MNYQNPYRIDDFNSSIIEWDIRAANVSICREYELLPLKTIEEISQMHKSKRERAIGLIMQKDRTFLKALEERFDSVMKIFLEQNNLDLDWDVLSIRRDAAFVINKTVKKPMVGQFIEFRPKNEYAHHIYLNPLDIYLKSDTREVDVKGINDELIPLHNNGILYLLRMICSCQSSSEPKKEINELLSNFVLLYKERALEFDFYREFNANSKYRVHAFDDEIFMDNIDSADLLEMTDITYNYEKVILPLVRMLRT